MLGVRTSAYENWGGKHNSTHNANALSMLAHLIFKTISWGKKRHYASLSTDEEVEAQQGGVIWPNCIGRKNGADMWTWTWWHSLCSFCYITADCNKIFGYLVCLLPLMTSPKCWSFIMSPDIRKIELYVTGIVIRGHDPCYQSLTPKAVRIPDRGLSKPETPQVEWELTAREKSRWDTRVHSVARARELSQIKAS